MTPKGVDAHNTFWCNAVMELRDYLKTLTPNDRTSFADRVGSSVGHLRNVGYGFRPCDPAVAVAIERESRKRVTRQELRPDDWEAIWPELRKRRTKAVA